MEIVHEEWRPVVGKFSGAHYEVSNLGRLRSTSQIRPSTYHRVLNSYMGNAGYFIRVLNLNGKRTNSNIHILVAEAFIGERPPGMQVNHKDGNKTNNLPENLEWVSRQEQQYHAIRIGLKKVRSGPMPSIQGERNPMSRLNNQQVREIYEAFKSGEHRGKIANRYGVSRGTVDRIGAGKRWSGVTSA